MVIRLRYIGDGAWLPGVPASDHEAENTALATELVASGLYERADGAKTAKTTTAPATGNPAADDESET